MATSVATPGSSRRSQFRSGTEGIVVGTGAGALLLRLAGKDPFWLGVAQFLSPAVSIVTSGAVIWLKVEWNEFVRRKMNQRELVAVRGRKSELKNYLETSTDPAARKQGEQLLAKLEKEELRLIAGL